MGNNFEEFLNNSEYGPYGVKETIRIVMTTVVEKTADDLIESLIKLFDDVEELAKESNFEVDVNELKKLCLHTMQERIKIKLLHLENSKK